MKDEDILYRPKVFGSTVVSPRGQVVCGHSHGQGLLLFKVEAVEQMLGLMSEQLSSFEQLVNGSRLPEVASGKGRAD
ncbi:hypothetical protein ACFLVO_03435 [Chloroflexota bacterium]